jgi:hypothetical protein
MAIVILFGPLLLAVATFVLAYLAGAKMLQTANGTTDELDGFAGRLAIVRQDISDLPPIPVPIELPDSVIEPEASEESEELSPLEKMIAARFTWLKNFNKGICVCSSSAGVTIAELTSRVWPPDSIAARLERVPDEKELAYMDQRIARLAVEVVQVLLSKCDHDLDPEFRNERLQEGIEWLASEAGLQLYMPEIGEPVDKRLHISLGVGERAGEELRGTVSSVRARGLIDAQNTVVTRAEVRQYA